MADLYLDHYERYIGPISGREVFRAPGGEWSIQILAFDGVFRGCRVYCSLGLTRYSEMIGEAVEVVLPVDPRWDIVPEVLANALFFAIEEKMELIADRCAAAHSVTGATVLWRARHLEQEVGWSDGRNCRIGEIGDVPRDD
jgi:hypothetical protein